MEKKTIEMLIKLSGTTVGVETSLIIVLSKLKKYIELGTPEELAADLSALAALREENNQLHEFIKKLGTNPKELMDEYFALTEYRKAEAEGILLNTSRVIKKISDEAIFKLTKQYRDDSAAEARGLRQAIEIIAAITRESAQAALKEQSK